MELIFHPLAAKEAHEIAEKYAAISEQLRKRFWHEFDEGVDSIVANPSGHHFDPSGYRRCNLHKFPYHLLFEERLDVLRIVVVRHDHRNPRYGTRRS